MPAWELLIGAVFCIIIFFAAINKGRLGYHAEEEELEAGDECHAGQTY